MKSTSALDMSIHAVSPVLRTGSTFLGFAGSAAAGAVDSTGVAEAAGAAGTAGAAVDAAGAAAGTFASSAVARSGSMTSVDSNSSFIVNPRNFILSSVLPILLVTDSLYAPDQTASSPFSPVLILTAVSSGSTNILPSPILPVLAVVSMVSITFATRSSITATSSFTFGRKSTTYSAPL